MKEPYKKTPPVLVSIIISTYNRARTISKAIDSVLAQTYPNFELIIIDDGSADNTGEVVAAYKDPRIKYKWVENGERSRARNIGIKMSQGKYVAFLDSDDWYLPNKLATQVPALEDNPHHGLVLGGWKVVDEAGKTLQSVRPWQWISTEPTLEEWLFASTATIHSVLVRKDCLTRVNGFDEELFMSEDIELWIRLVQAGCSVIWTKEVVAAYVVHEKNSLRNWPKVKQGKTRFLKKIFSNPKIKRKLSVTESEVLAQHHLSLAFEAIEADLPERSQQELTQAVEHNPSLVAQDGAELEKYIINHSQYFLVTHSIKFVEQFFENLPHSLSHIKQYRRRVLGKTWMSQAWRAHKKDDLKRVRYSIFQAIWYHPSCLKDRGILSMLFESLLGRRIWQSTRLFFRGVIRQD